MNNDELLSQRETDIINKRYPIYPKLPHNKPPQTRITRKYAMTELPIFVADTTYFDWMEEYLMDMIDDDKNWEKEFDELMEKSIYDKCTDDIKEDVECLVPFDNPKDTAEFNRKVLNYIYDHEDKFWENLYGTIEKYDIKVNPAEREDYYDPNSWEWSN